MATKKLSNNDVNTITKSEIADEINKKFDSLNAYESNLILNKIISTITSTISNKRSVMLKNVGTLAVVEKSPRKGVRNPKTGEEMVLGARTVVTLKGTHRCENKLNTGELIDKLLEDEQLLEFNFNHVTIKESVDTFLDLIRSIPDKKYRIEIRGFGVFFPTLVSSKWSRNPKTGEKVFVEEHMKLSFKLSKVLKRELN